MVRPSIDTRVILDAAAELISTNGFAAIRMDAIAAHAGVAKGVLYLRFRNKDDLLTCLVRREIATVTRHTVELAERDPLGGLLSRVFVHVTAAMHGNPVVIRAYRDEQEVLSRLVRSGDPARFERRAVLGATFLLELQDVGMIVPDVDIEALATNLALWNTGLASASPHPDVEALIVGMGDLLHRAADAPTADTAPGKRVLARFADSLIEEMTT